MNRDMKDEKVPPGNDVGKQQMQRTWGRKKLDKLEEKQGGECECSGVSWGEQGEGCLRGQLGSEHPGP